MIRRGITKRERERERERERDAVGRGRGEEKRPEGVHREVINMEHFSS